MAIDMIERTDEGAHAPSRLGDFQFADDSKHFRNFTGGEDFFQGKGEDWANLWGINIFGDEIAKNNAKRATQEGNDFVAKLPTFKKDDPTCDEILKSLELIGVWVETQTKELATAKGHVQTYPKNRMAPARAEEGRIKLIQTKKDCIAIAEKAKAEAAKAETLKTIQTLSEQSIQNAKTDLLGVNEALAKQPATPSIVQNKNLLLYGAVGLSAILLILLIKRK